MTRACLESRIKISRRNRPIVFPEDLFTLIGYVRRPLTALHFVMKGSNQHFRELERIVSNRSKEKVKPRNVHNKYLQRQFSPVCLGLSQNHSEQHSSGNAPQKSILDFPTESQVAIMSLVSLQYCFSVVAVQENPGKIERNQMEIVRPQ